MDFREKVLEYEEDFLKNLRRLVRIPSFEGEKEREAPFGMNPRLALEEALKISEELGFKTKNIENAIGYAEYGNHESEDYIGIIGHIDVVKEGENWTYPPFDMTRVGDRLFGRGVLDNKGPTLSTLYALKILKDMDLKLDRNVRIIFGTNEETGFKDIKYYLDKEKPPVMGFTPDCKFPVVYGEKGVVQIKLSKKLEGSNSKIFEIKGEFANNIVPSSIEIGFKKWDLEELKGLNHPSLKIEERLDKTSLIFKGKGAHGKSPEEGDNAITSLSNILADSKMEEGEVKEFFSFVNKVFHEKHFGEGCNLEFQDESGKLVINPYKMYFLENEIGLVLQIRYPVGLKYEEIYNKLEFLSKENNLEIEILKRLDSVNMDREGKLIKTLERVYEFVTGNDGKAVPTTGGTYAKVMPNIVAFGPSIGGMDGNPHMADEFIDIEELRINMEVFCRAIYELANTK
ncbi:Sapep family Mn(2+)-dependent dipeptidase [Clostridium sp.]|uniref:Sapep family Mn(2+)-dependent dipeptidase n=1 Tax=Clostridium sp. TaxID=1506 RepID=UPI002608CC30|nr:Sapep family Mn(2+)-dependent dipeptidase [Clostridium sp.]